MSRKTAQVSGGDTGTAPQYNFLRDEAVASSWLLAYGTSTIKVMVNAGLAYMGGSKVEFAGGYSPLMTAPSASSRIDVVSMTSAGVIAVTAGTETDSPTAPTPPEDDMPICEIYHRAGEVEITDTDESAGEGYINKDLRKALQVIQNSTYEDVTASRAIDTIYQNTSGKTMMILVTVACSSGISAGEAIASALVENVSPPTDIVGQFANSHGSGYGTLSWANKGMLTLVVPDDYYYKIVETHNSGGGVSLIKWIEITPGW